VVRHAASPRWGWGGVMRPRRLPVGAGKAWFVTRRLPVGAGEAWFVHGVCPLGLGRRGSSGGLSPLDSRSATPAAPFTSSPAGAALAF
jgi:hypothetical protein